MENHPFLHQESYTGSMNHTSQVKRERCTYSGHTWD